MGLAKYSISLMMVAIFSIAIITFAINFAGDNSSEVSLADDSDFASTSNAIGNDVVTFYEGVNTSNTAFQESTISSQTESSEGGTQFKVTPPVSVKQVTKVIDVGWSKIFGSDSEFRNVFLSITGILVFIMGLYAYKAWAGRNPD